MLLPIVTTTTWWISRRSFEKLRRGPHRSKVDSQPFCPLTHEVGTLFACDINPRTPNSLQSYTLVCVSRRLVAHTKDAFCAERETGKLGYFSLVVLTLPTQCLCETTVSGVSLIIRERAFPVKWKILFSFLPEQQNSISRVRAMCCAAATTLLRLLRPSLTLAQLRALL